ncbi:ABC transporter permease [Roseovarius aquimarinus]|uniref:ABC transporter permease n=1 Tax=Roseovarius aquimarinus TaxID=1229156 RepID=A0ABW7I7H4_9RHOB
MTLRLLGKAYMGLCALFIVLPIMVVMGAALNGGRSMLFPPKDVTFDRFAEFFYTDPSWVRALGNSLVTAGGSAALAVLLAWPIAYGLWRHGSGLSKAIAGLGTLPFALPPIVFGVGLSFLWTFTGGLGHMWAGVLSHTAFFLALPIVMISIGLQSIDPAHIDAARTMGADGRAIFRTIVFPQMMPYSASGFFFVLVLSFNEFIIMFFVSSSAYSTVTVKIFNSLRNGFTPTMAVGAITFITVSIIAFSLIARFGNLPRLLGADHTNTN